MNTFVTADTHFGCQNLIEQTRKWSSILTHDDYVLSNINGSVGRSDRLIILGDFCKYPRDVAMWRSRINCKRIDIVLGNHDKRGRMESVFGKQRVQESLLLKHGPEKTLVYLSHYPHVHYPHSHYGAFHAYGHVHAQKEYEMDQMMPDRRSMDVGVDNAWKRFARPRPYLMEEVLDLLRDRPGHGLIKPEDRWKKRDYPPVS